MKFNKNFQNCCNKMNINKNSQQSFRIGLMSFFAVLAYHSF